jgi:hypothetical protein
MDLLSPQSFISMNVMRFISWMTSPKIHQALYEEEKHLTMGDIVERCTKQDKLLHRFAYNLTKWGIHSSKGSIALQQLESALIPVYDTGTVRQIKKGKIGIKTSSIKSFYEVCMSSLCNYGLLCLANVWIRMVWSLKMVNNVLMILL